MDPTCEFPFTKNYETFLKSPITVPGRKMDLSGAMAAIAKLFSQDQENCFALDEPSSEPGATSSSDFLRRFLRAN